MGHAQLGRPATHSGTSGDARVAGDAADGGTRPGPRQASRQVTGSQWLVRVDNLTVGTDCSLAETTLDYSADGPQHWGTSGTGIESNRVR